MQEVCFYPAVWKVNDPADREGPLPCVGFHFSSGTQRFSRQSRGEEHRLARLTLFQICFTKGPFSIFSRLWRVLWRSDVAVESDFWCIQSSDFIGCSLFFVRVCSERVSWWCESAATGVISFQTPRCGGETEVFHWVIEVVVVQSDLIKAGSLSFLCYLRCNLVEIQRRAVKGCLLTWGQEYSERVILNFESFQRNFNKFKA